MLFLALEPRDKLILVLYCLDFLWSGLPNTWVHLITKPTPSTIATFHYLILMRLNLPLLIDDNQAFLRFWLS